MTSFRWPRRIWEWPLFLTPALVVFASVFFAPDIVRLFGLGPPDWASPEADCAMFGAWIAGALCFILALWRTVWRLPDLTPIENCLAVLFLSYVAFLGIAFVNFSIVAAVIMVTVFFGNGPH